MSRITISDELRDELATLTGKLDLMAGDGKRIGVLKLFDGERWVREWEPGPDGEYEMPPGVSPGEALVTGIRDWLFLPVCAKSWCKLVVLWSFSIRRIRRISTLVR